MKIISSTTNSPYLYIFKHGIGPGTMPSDVSIVKVRDLPNYYTAVWLDRFLTTDEMRQYDIPSETEINYYLDRIGYCQKDGDVVPCDDVEACDKVLASSANYGNNLYADRKVIAKLLHQEIEDELHSRFPDDDYPLAGNIIDKDTIGFQAHSDEKTTLYAPIIKEVLKKYNIAAKAHSNKYIGKYISFNLWNISHEAEKLLADLVHANDVEGCDNVMAAKTIRWSQLSDSDQFAVEYAISYLDSNYGGIENVSDDDYLLDAARYGCNIASEGNAEPEYENEDFYMDEPDFDKVFNYLKSKSSCRDITCTTDIDDDDEDEIYWVQAYYGTPRRGMATDFATNDWDEAIDKLVEYANQGYHVVFENLASGEGYAYDADEILEAVDFGDIYTLRRLESLYEG